MDLLIKDADIIDGTGKKPYKGSIAVTGDKITALEVEADADETIDARGLTAVPGFIDSHSHADWSMLFFPKCESYILQGVTTFVGGQCGMSLAPIGDKINLPGIARDHLQELIRYKYYPKQTVFERDRVNEVMEKHFGWTIDWRTSAELFEAVEKRGIACNFAPLVGHNTVRRTVMEDDFERASTKEEREEMAELIHGAMGDGCLGMSVGLDYDPSCFADRDELVTHASIMNEYGGVYAPHSRRTGRRRNIAAGHRQHDKIDGIHEVLDICSASGVRMNIAHLFTGWYVQPQGYPHMLEEANRRSTLKVIDDALEEGMDLSFDVIPTALPTRYGGWQYLCALFEPWLREKGSRDEFAEWLKVEDFRQEVKEAIRSGKWFIRVAYNPNTNPRWAENITVLEHKNKETANKTIAQIAEMRETDAFDTWLDLIAEDPDAKSAIATVYPSGTVDPDAPYHDIFYQHPVSCVGVDTGVDDYKHVPKAPPWTIRGINNYSAFVGFWEKFVNKQRSLTPEQAVHKTSTQAANRHAIKGRGALKEGHYADIVLMDLPKMKVTGTALEPRNQPGGIEYVIVNGVPVVEKSRHTGATPGVVIKRG